MNSRTPKKTAEIRQNKVILKLIKLNLFYLSLLSVPIPIYVLVLHRVSDRTVKPASGLNEAIWRVKPFLKSLLFYSCTVSCLSNDVS